MDDNDILTQEEHQAMELTATLWNYLSQNVVSNGPTRDADMRELMFHVHGIQRAIMGQAAARAYPDKYRLLGGELPHKHVCADKECVHPDEEPLGHSCSCHLKAERCGVCVALNCPIPSENRRTDEIVDMREPGEAWCKDCPDREACSQGQPCSLVKRVNQRLNKS